MTSSALIDRARRLIIESVDNAEIWDSALTAFAEACGGHSGQLIARDEHGKALLHLLTNVDDGATEAAEAHGLGILAANPRLRIGQSGALLAPVLDQDHVDRNSRRLLPIYAEFFEPFDVAFNCQVVLYRSPQLLLRASVSRSSSRGPMDEEHVRAFETLAPYIAMAARTEFIAERKSIDHLIHAADSLGDRVFLLDQAAKLVHLSREAAIGLAHGEILARRDRKLVCPPDNARFQRAIAAAIAVWNHSPGEPCTEIPCWDHHGFRSRLRVVALARKMFTAPKSPAVLVLWSGGTPGVTTDDLRSGYGLTEAEGAIALLIADGRSLHQIARLRDVSIGTVRRQLREVFAKMGVNRQAELVARLR